MLFVAFIKQIHSNISKSCLKFSIFLHFYKNMDYHVNVWFLYTRGFSEIIVISKRTSLLSFVEIYKREKNKKGKMRNNHIIYFNIVWQFSRAQWVCSKFVGQIKQSMEFLSPWGSWFMQIQTTSQTASWRQWWTECVRTSERYNWCGFMTQVCLIYHKESHNKRS